MLGQLALETVICRCFLPIFLCITGHIPTTFYFLSNQSASLYALVSIKEVHRKSVLNIFAFKLLLFCIVSSPGGAHILHVPRQCSFSIKRESAHTMAKGIVLSYRWCYTACRIKLVMSSSV